MVVLKAMLGTYPHTKALKSGFVASDSLRFDIADVASASTAFKRVVALEFDIAELSVMTFLIAKARGAPLTLMPADLFKRAKPPDLLYKASQGRRSLADFKSPSIGVAYYTATTSIWMQCLLANAGLDPRTVRWVAVDGPLDPDFRDPENVERAPPGVGLNDLLERGDVDAIVSTALTAGPGVEALSFDGEPVGIPDLVLPTNFESHHMLVVKQGIVRDNPAVVRELWRMLLAARELAVNSSATKVPLYGFKNNRAHLEAALAAAAALGFVQKDLTADVIFDELAVQLAGAN